MPRTKQTLFDQIKDERGPLERRTLNQSPILRVLIIVVSIAAMAAFFISATGEDTQIVEAGLVGRVWTEESVVADYAFPVSFPEDIIERNRTLAASSAPAVFRTDSMQLRDWIAKLSIADANVITPSTKNIAQRFLESEFNSGVVNVDRTVFASQMIGIESPGMPTRIVPAEQVHDMRQASDAVTNIVRREIGDRPDIASAIMACITPNLKFDSLATLRAREEAAASIATTSEIVQAGEVIVRKGERVDTTALRRLSSYRDAQYLRNTVRVSWLVFVGSVGHACIIVSMLVLFLALLRRSSFDRNAQLAGLLALPVLSAGMGWLSMVLPTSIPLEYGLLIPALAMIISVLFDARTAFVCAVSMSLAAAGARGNDYAIALEMLTASTLASYAANRIQSRTQIFTSIVAVFLGLAITILIISLERSLPFSMMWQPILVSAVNAVASPLITLGVIIVIERVFNVATDMRLDEFDNINHPLLIELNERAPGTYQHTLAVSRLAEAAAAAIGANALLAKVGVLFHDIGKIEKSEYFVENQLNIGNKHDRLTPKKSASIIRQHVQDGIELAKEYNLPERIWKFIPMHHGTMIIRHFYATAVLENNNSADGIDELDFRYPGPKPDSKETAIAMLADAAEALSRIVNTGQRVDLQSAIDKIIIDRLEDGQLSESPLTTQDLSVIREAFVKNLLASSHNRVRYKGTEIPPAEPSAS